MPLAGQSSRHDAQRKRRESVLILHGIITYVQNQEDRHGTYTVRLRRVRGTTVAVEEQ